MKVIKYDVKVKVETKDPKREFAKLHGLLIGRFTKDERKYKEQVNNILQGKAKSLEINGIKASINENVLEVEGIKFRKLINVRKFIDETTKKYEMKCGQLNRSENLLTKQCEGENIKVYFEIKPERIKPIKKTTEEKKEESKETQQSKS
ncbi:hypothetical protein [Sulfurisphaera ohwakuensis]|uniref:hypothetical protein n=1 Tax=Sulfurisphaera ohwakuensis TaxID=69656 RepID=UPI0036F4360A